MACGMAVSAGLLAAGCVASAAGYPALGTALINALSSLLGFLTRPGSCVRKGALFQGASQAASGFSSLRSGLLKSAFLALQSRVLEKTFVLR